jgi:hypothetical protein
MAVAGLLCFAMTSAKATSVSIVATNTAFTACPAGTAGTLTTNSSGGIVVEFLGVTTGCYIGDSGVTGAASTYIGSLTTEGSASGLNSLSTGWYAENGAMCDATGSCSTANNSTNNNTSGDFEVLINRGSSSTTFQIYNTGGTVDSAGNPGITGGCTYVVNSGAATFTVAANTICFEDLSTGASIAIDVNAPTSTPEVATMLLVATGLFLMALVGRRVSNHLPSQAPKSATMDAVFSHVPPTCISSGTSE